MKIKLALLVKDQSYLNRIVSVFSTKYSDKFEIYSFTEAEMAINTVRENRINVLIAEEAFDIDVSLLPPRCGFAYFVDSPDVESLNDQKVICKFQKADLIYKQILSLYSENAGNISGLKIHDDNTVMFVFSSPCGGAGTSTAAAACAACYAAKGYKTLYLNLEKFGSAESFFYGEGQFDMSDIIYALKSKKANLAMKLESCVKQDRSGVHYFAPTKVALDMLELKFEDIMRLISEIRLVGYYDYIIIDMEFVINDDMIAFYKKAHRLVLVSDGSVSANTKVARAYEAMALRDQNTDLPVTELTCLIYNKYSKTSQPISGVEIRNIGGAPKYEHATPSQIIAQMSAMGLFEKLSQ